MIKKNIPVSTYTNPPNLSNGKEMMSPPEQLLMFQPEPIIRNPERRARLRGISQPQLPRAPRILPEEHARRIPEIPSGVLYRPGPSKRIENPKCFGRFYRIHELKPAQISIIFKGTHTNLEHLPPRHPIQRLENSRIITDVFEIKEGVCDSVGFPI